ncbi:MAG TPA: 3-phosphoserine/phosphohydroxythreonine transaminase [Pirellulales bacterium]|nr:3-phosphoserine/phosphohydroxythreonine transaminase [Pirellulales bacterium]
MSSATLTERVFNFSPGPAVLPLPVLEQAQRELVCLPGYGMSVLEMSHRAPGFLDILAATKRLLKELLAIPDNYQIIFLQGGSRLQFSMVPMNLLRGQAGAAEYLVTGSWSKLGLEEARREGKTNIAWDGKGTNYDRLPKPGEIKLSPGAAYAYFCSNETIQGVQFASEPDLGASGSNVPLVCDASSDFLHRPLPIARYGLVYACAQKNAGPAGVTVVIIRDDLLKRSQDSLPGYLSYANHVKEDSLYNTPPCFAIYLMKLVLEWLKDEIGGLARMHAINQQKARLLYDAIDESAGFYRGHAQPDVRSLMNVTFRLPSEALEKEFVKEGEDRDLDGLKGHRSVGGIRASIYNAMPTAGIEALASFMREFKQKKG